MNSPVPRTRLLLAVLLCVFHALLGCGGNSSIEESRQATRVKVGEVTDASATIWMRVTASETRRADGVERRSKRQLQ